MALLMIWFWPWGSALEWSARLAQRSVFAAAGAAAKTSATRRVVAIRDIAPDVRRSVELRARVLHHLRPAVLLRADERAELGRGLRAQLRAGLVEALLHLRGAQHLRDGGVELGHDLRRRAGGRHDALERTG